ncbi:MAG: MaoC family dehydratase [Candidatus Deferrimicrobium sp.]
MCNSISNVPIKDRYFEDYTVGLVQECGTIAITEDEVINFARRFDPQIFHTDPENAKKTHFAGIIASGWHTCGLVMRLLVDNYLSKVANIASPGVDEIRWIRPVRPGDELSVRAIVLAARTSRSKPERGIFTYSVEVINQGGEVVMTMKVLSIMLRRGGK